MREVTEYFLEMTHLWQELDLSLEEEWDCTGDSVRYKKRVENERVFEFLAGLNRDLDDVRGRILGRRPLPTTREVFAEVRREENRRKIMLKTGDDEIGVETVMFSKRSGPGLRRNDGLSRPVTLNGPNGLAQNRKSGGWAEKLHNGPGQSVGAIGPGGQHIGLEMNASPSSGPKQLRGHPWCEHCRKPEHKEDTCWDLHGKPNDWKPRQNSRNRGYQASIDPIENTKDNNSTAGGAFNPEQLEQLYQIFSNLQNSNHHSTHSPSSSLAHKGNHLIALTTSSKYKVPWIIDSGASDHMTDSHHLFSTYTPCAGNIKVKIADGSLSTVAGKWSIQISKSITLNSVLHVPNLSCNLLSVSQLTKKSNCSVEFFPSYCVFQDLSSRKTIGSAREYAGLYYFEEADVSKPSQIAICDSAYTSRDSEVLLWHY